VVLVQHPELVASNLAIGATSAGWYWQKFNGNGDNTALAAPLMLPSFKKITRNINGGLTGEEGNRIFTGR
jgi:hypothetical protein